MKRIPITTEVDGEKVIIGEGTAEVRDDGVYVTGEIYPEPADTEP